MKEVLKLIFEIQKSLLSLFEIFENCVKKHKNGKMKPAAKKGESAQIRCDLTSNKN